MFQRHNPQSLRRSGQAILALALLVGCTLGPGRPAPVPTPSAPSGNQTLSADEIAKLSSLDKLDDFPLYSLRYHGDYTLPELSAASPGRSPIVEQVAAGERQAGWGCALVAALGDPARRLYGRNFDWRFSPALLLFTDPADGYASVAMVDIEYLGFEGSRALNLTDLPLEQRKALLDAPALPFDGMNERGLAVGMASVPPGGMRPDPDKPTVDHLGVMRAILDHAGSVEQAVEILASYNIDMGSVPLHYLIASAAGDAALVEFYQGEMFVLRNENPWQLATNFLLAASGGQPQGQCPRYDRLSRRLEAREGQLTTQEAFNLLEEVSQGGAQSQASTQWSVVYDLTGGEVSVIMGQKFGEKAHSLRLSIAENK